MSRTEKNAENERKFKTERTVMSYVESVWCSLVVCKWVHRVWVACFVAVELCCRGYEEPASSNLDFSSEALINLTASGVAMSDGRFDPS